MESKIYLIVFKVFTCNGGVEIHTAVELSFDDAKKKMREVFNELVEENNAEVGNENTYIAVGENSCVCEYVPKRGKEIDIFADIEEILPGEVKQLYNNYY